MVAAEELDAGVALVRIHLPEAIFPVHVVRTRFVGVVVSVVATTTTHGLFLEMAHAPRRDGERRALPERIGGVAARGEGAARVEQERRAPARGADRADTCVPAREKAVTQWHMGACSVRFKGSPRACCRRSAARWRQVATHEQAQPIRRQTQTQWRGARAIEPRSRFDRAAHKGASHGRNAHAVAARYSLAPGSPSRARSTAIVAETSRPPVQLTAIASSTPDALAPARACSKISSNRARSQRSARRGGP